MHRARSKGVLSRKSWTSSIEGTSSSPQQQAGADKRCTQANPRSSPEEPVVWGPHVSEIVMQACRRLLMRCCICASTAAASYQHSLLRAKCRLKREICSAGSSAVVAICAAAKPSLGGAEDLHQLRVRALGAAIPYCECSHPASLCVLVWRTRTAAGHWLRHSRRHMTCLQNTAHCSACGYMHTFGTDETDRTAARVLTAPPPSSHTLPPHRTRPTRSGCT